MENAYKYTLLIVDDSPESVDILRGLLRHKYRLKVALNGSKALEIASSQPAVDLILLDIAMPVMNGYQVCERLKADPITRDIPVIFVSALSDTLEKVRAFESGAVDYITKPYEPEEVLARVRMHLDLLTLHRSLVDEITLRRQAEAALQQANDTLEKRVQERTQELAEANARLVQEIQERTKIAQENEHLLEQVRSLARYQQEIVEEERTRISRELHDEFGPNLTALKMDTVWLARHLSDNEQQRSDRLAGMSSLLDDTLQRVRRVAHELRPGVLDELGLLAALEWQAQEFSGRMNIPCSLELNSDVASFGRDLDTTIFRICQEALTNIARHAVASQIRVTLKNEGNRIEFSVEDNGKGITTEQAEHPRAFGLIGMRERARIWNGEISITGVPDHGTRVKVCIPLGKIQRGVHDPGSHR